MVLVLGWFDMVESFPTCWAKCLASMWGLIEVRPFGISIRSWQIGQVLAGIANNHGRYDEVGTTSLSAG